MTGWVVPAPDPVDGPLTGAEGPMLAGYLRWQRSVLLDICAGLTGEQLATRALPPSELSLLGLVRHLAKVERIWLRIRVAGQPIEHLYGGPGDPEDFADIDPGRARAEVEQLREESRLCDEAVAGIDLDHEISTRGRAMSLRMVYLHLIGEYARHNGHADLLREQLDGVTGR